MSAALALLVAAFLATAPWGGPLVKALLRHGVGKNIRYDGPASHQTKAGTATMGGLLFLVPTLLGGVALALWVDATLWVAVGAMLIYGALGAYDDLQGLRDRQGVGWLARFKFIWQWALAGLVGVALYLAPESRTLRFPATELTIYLGGWIVPIAAFFVVAFGNGVNFADGLDGLAGGTSLLAFGAFGALALASGQLGLGLFCALLVGALLAFLWHNAHPASMFMGDVGSQALGAGLAVVAVLSGQWLLLPHGRNRRADLRGVVRIVIHHHHAPGFPFEFSPTLHAVIAAQMRRAVRQRHPHRSSGQHCRRRVERIMAARDIQPAGRHLAGHLDHKR